MRKTTVSHEYLKKYIHEFMTLAEDAPDETFLKIFEEIRHSCLIVAGDISGKELNMMTAMTTGGDFGMLFTDMDEFRRVFPDFEVQSHVNLFRTYTDMMSRSNLAGYVINMAGEAFIMPRDMVELMGDAPVPDHSLEGAYTSEELKCLKDSMDNSKLEQFLKDPSNVYDYEKLFDLISSSTLLTLMVSGNNIKAENGVIFLEKSGPNGALYIDRMGGNYATVYTSEEKISKVDLPKSKYSQIIDFSYMVNFTLFDDLDGIVINPRSDNIILTRDILLEFSEMLSKTCSDSKLSSATYYMFPVEV